MFVGLGELNERGESAWQQWHLFWSYCEAMQHLFQVVNSLRFVTVVVRTLSCISEHRGKRIFWSPNERCIFSVVFTEQPLLH